MKSEITTPDSIAKNCACFNTRKAARAVTQLYDSFLKPAGLRGTQFTLLVALSARGTVGITQLADALVMERTTLTRNLRPLKKQGLVSVVEGSDRRTRKVMITAAGRKKFEETIPFWEQAQKTITQGLGDSDLQIMLDSFSKVTQLTRRI